MKPQYCSRVQRWSEMNWAGWVSPVAASRPQARLCPAGGAVWAAACWSLRDPLVCTRRNQLHCSAENTQSPYSLRGENQLQLEQEELSLISPHLRSERGTECCGGSACVCWSKAGNLNTGRNPPAFTFQTQFTVQDEKAWRKRSVPEMIEH